MPVSAPDRARSLVRGKRAAPRLWHAGAGTPPPDAPFVALVPGAEAPILRATLPDTLKGAAREAVALRQLRDRLGTGTEGLVLRPARLGKRDEGWSGVLCVGRQAISGWQAGIGSARGRCRALLPDYLALPATPGLWCIQTAPDGGEVRARLGLHDGFSAETPLAGVMLAQALERARALGTPPAAVLRLGPPDGGVDAALEGLAIRFSADDLPAGIAPPRVLAHGELALDLGHDPQSAATAARSRLAALRWPLLLAALGLAGWLGSVAIETRRDLARAEAITAATIDAVRRDFLPSGPLLDIPVQVGRVLEDRRDAGPEPAGPLESLRAAAAHLARHPQALQSLAFDSGTPVTLDLRLPDFATLEALLGALRADGLALTLARSGIEPDGQVSASVTLGNGGGE